jgi:hypothetical protein
MLTGTVPSGTANGVLYLNGSKVVTSGSGLTFDGTNFTVGSKTTLRSDGPFLTGANLTSGANPLAIGGGAGNSVVAFFVNNAEQMRLTSTGLGIGTSSPNYKLDVQDASSGAVRIRTTSSGNANLIIQTVAGGTAAIDLENAAGTNRIIGGLGGTSNLSFHTSGSEQMRLTSTGLGIGTSSPSNGAKLDAAGAIIATNATLSSFNANNAGFDFVTASKIGRFFATSTDTTGGVMTFTTGQNGTYAERMRLDSSGNLGIGTSSPGHKLTVHGGINVTSSATLPAGQGSMLFSYEAPVNRIYMGDGTGYSFAFSKRVSSTTTDLVTLTDAGNLGIGTTSPASAIHASRASGVAVYLQLAQTGVASWQIGMSASSNGLAFLQSGSEKIRIKETGQLRYIPLAADPAGAENGDVYYNSTTNKLRVYAGGAWVDLH